MQCGCAKGCVSLVKNSKPPAKRGVLRPSRPAQTPPSDDDADAAADAAAADENDHDNDNDDNDDNDNNDKEFTPWKCMTHAHTHTTQYAKLQVAHTHLGLAGAVVGDTPPHFLLIGLLVCTAHT